MQTVFNIPLEEHLLKFVVAELWEGQSAPYFVDERSLLGKFIFSTLIDKRKFTQASSTSIETVLTIELSHTFAKRSPDLIKLSRINRFLEELFKRSLITWVRAQMKMGNNRYQSVKSFLKFYDLDHPAMEDRYYLFIKRYQYIPYRFKVNEKNAMEQN